MSLAQYVENHPNEGITFIPFKQPQGHCFGLSAAWLRWFLTAREPDLLAGRFDPYSQQDMILSLQQNSGLPDWHSVNYRPNLNKKLQQLQLRPEQHSYNDHSTMLDALQLEHVDYNRAGGLVFASEPIEDSTNIGHVMPFGIRRFPEFNDVALFGFFDANEGILFIKLNDFPPAKTGFRNEIDTVNDTSHWVSTFNSHMQGLSRIESFFREIQPEYPYQKFHCDKVNFMGTVAPRSPVLFSRKRNESTSPRSLNRSNSSISPKNRHRLSHTIQTHNSITK